MDWVGPDPPTADGLAGRDVLTQAKSRWEAITNTGGEVLGMRPLDLDGLVAVDPNDYTVGAVHQVWGWAAICTYAEEAFAK
jgi:hypothetical protein